MAVPFEQTTPLDLRQAPHPLDLDQLRGVLELSEVLLDLGVRLVGDRARPERLDRQAQSAHVRNQLTAGGSAVAVTCAIRVEHMFVSWRSTRAQTVTDVTLESN